MHIQRKKIGALHLAAIQFARFFSFRFRTRPRTFYGASERFAKPRMEIIISFSSRATPCEPSKAIRRLRTDRIAARFSLIVCLFFAVVPSPQRYTSLYHCCDSSPIPFSLCLFSFLFSLWFFLSFLSFFFPFLPSFFFSLFSFLSKVDKWAHLWLIAQVMVGNNGEQSQQNLIWSYLNIKGFNVNKTKTSLSCS